MFKQIDWFQVSSRPRFIENQQFLGTCADLLPDLGWQGMTSEVVTDSWKMSGWEWAG